MEIYTSYFYQIRFFRPNMIPLSTAIWDPRWYHDGHDQSYTFVDKRGVINGLRCEALKPEFSEELHDPCKGPANCSRTPSTCEFLQMYRKHLASIDSVDYIRRIENLCKKVQKQLGFLDDPIPVLIVHEAPSNPCSERGPLQEWAKCVELQYPIR